MGGAADTMAPGPELAALAGQVWQQTWPAWMMIS